MTRTESIGLTLPAKLHNASATDHIDVCRHLAAVFKTDRTIALLPDSLGLPDAGMAAMDLIAESLRNESRVELDAVAAMPRSRAYL